MDYQSLILIVEMFFLSLLAHQIKAERRNVAFNKKVSASSLYHAKAWQDFSNIVDGNLTRDGNACECCASTEYSVNSSWITVDLEQYYWIDGVTLYGRTDEYEYEGQSFRYLEMHFIHHSEITDNTMAAYTVRGSGFINFVNVTLGDQTKARVFTLYRPEGYRIPVCELEIYGTDCRYGLYGTSCSESCGHCYNGEPCNEVTGECGICAAGFKGTQCKTACDDGFYGSGCLSVCRYCYNGEPCDKIDGTCEQCDAGYQGRLCDTECLPGTFGQNCSEVCGFCHEYVHCNHVTGYCVDGCFPGRRGSLCKQDCETNSFGDNCSYTCHCKDGVLCHSVTGTCEDSACAEGYSGLGCQQSSSGKQNYNAENPMVLPISIGVGVFLICIIVGLVAFVVFLKRRNTRTETPDVASNTKDTQPYDDIKF